MTRTQTAEKYIEYMPVLYLTGDESAEKLAYGLRCLLREESFRAMVVEIPRLAAPAERAVRGIYLALSGEDTRKQVVALASREAGVRAVADLRDLRPLVQVVRTAAEAAAAVGKD